jgi:hypothetical protein
MPFIPLNLDDAKEARPVPAGRYDLVITSCEETLTKEKQKPQFKMALQIEGHDDAPPVYHYQGIPSESDETQAQQFKMLLLKRFLKLFKVPYSADGFDTDKLAMELVGARANVELQLGEPYNGNVSNVLVVPKLKDEEGPGRGKPPARKAA